MRGGGISGAELLATSEIGDDPAIDEPEDSHSTPASTGVAICERLAKISPLAERLRFSPMVPVGGEPLTD